MKHMSRRIFALLLALCLLMGLMPTGALAAGEATGYTVTAVAQDTEDQQHYNPGDEIKVDIKISTQNGTTSTNRLGAFGFQLDFDTNQLVLSGVATELEGGTLSVNKTVGNDRYGRVGWAPTDGADTAGGAGATPVYATGEGVTVATATFTVKQGITTGEAQIGIKDDTASLDVVNHDVWITVGQPTVGTPEKVNLHNITVKFDLSSIGQAEQTAYVKYGETGFYANDSYTADSFTVPAPAASADYRLNSPLWKDGDNKTYTDKAAVEAATFTKDTVLTLQATKLYTWSYTEPAGVTLGNLTGVDENNKVGADQDITFTLTPADGHVVSSAQYTVGEGTPTVINADESGKYTIPKEKVTGNITLTVTTTTYHTVTFQAGDGSTMAATTLYVKHDIGGLYSDRECTKPADTVPTPNAIGGYRLALDTVNEPLWIGDKGSNYTSASIKQAKLTTNVILTAQTVQQHKVTFTAADGNVTISGNFMVDHGKTIADKLVNAAGVTVAGGDIPAVSYTDGYVFDKWMIGDTEIASDDALRAAAINANTTFTLYAKAGQFNVTLTDNPVAAFTDLGGLTGDANPYTAAYNTDVTFKLAAKTGHDLNEVTKVTYAVDGGEPQPLTSSAEGVYTIPGTAITGVISITVESANVYTLTFAAGENGAIAGTASFTLAENTPLTGDQLTSVKPTANPGYRFKEWQINGAAVTEDQIKTAQNANTTITAVFEPAEYTVTHDGITGVDNTATYGTDFIFTPAVEGETVLGIDVTIGGTAYTPTKNADGSYTIAGSAITGNIVVTAITATGTFTFITAEEYKALAKGGNTKIAVYDTDKLANQHYALTDGTEFYWSEKYQAYVKIVDKDETAASLSVKLAVAGGAAEEVDYSGDVDGDGYVKPSDAGWIDCALHQSDSFAPSDLQRLACDVTGDAKKVDVTDIMHVLKTYTGASE